MTVKREQPKTPTSQPTSQPCDGTADKKDAAYTLSALGQPDSGFDQAVRLGIPLSKVEDPDAFVRSLIGKEHDFSHTPPDKNETTVESVAKAIASLQKE